MELLNEELSKEELSPADLKSTKSTTIRYARQGSTELAHVTSEFEWTDYSPAVFRRLLEFYSIDYDDYRLAICRDETLREVSLPGRPGRLFIVSNDKQLVVKTLRKSEFKVYLEMLPNYYRHVKKYAASLLIKLFGLHVVRPGGGFKVYLAVLRTTRPSDIFLDKVFDLKGSSKGRASSRIIAEDRPIYKEPEFDYCFYLDPLVRARLLAQIQYDCEFLEVEGLMDYSLLLGIHIEPSKEGSIDKSSSRNCRSSRSSSAEKKTDYTFEEDKSSELTLADMCDELNRPGFKFGERLPARAVRGFRNDGGSKSGSSTRAQERFNVLLYFGIADYCQSYNMTKRIEHVCGAIRYDSKTVKTVNPKAYASRFQEFLSEIFLPEESD